MAERKIFTVTDLGPGDGGKGGVVHKLSTLEGAHTVIKMGGAQGSHGVRTASGQSFNFSQFGCGAFDGLNTHISSLMIIEPYRFLEEAQRLRYQAGISNILDTVTVDGDALCITPYHGIASKLRELYRGDNQKGTVGIGGGEALRDSENYPRIAIRAKDCGGPLVWRLRALRDQKLRELAPIIDRIGSLPESDQLIARTQVGLLTDDGFPERIEKEFQRFAGLVKIVDLEYFAKNILDKDGISIVECSHGVLTDRLAGFHPHTSYLRTLPQSMVSLIESCGYDGRIIKLGISRGYQVRHGAGPLVTEDPSMLESLLPGSHKEDNRWQGSIRVGPLDLVALRYSIAACGGSDFFDGLAITWFDQIKLAGTWKVCDRYLHASDTEFLTPKGDIVSFTGSQDECFERQGRLTRMLAECTYDARSYHLGAYVDNEEIAALCGSVLTEALGVPVRMISFGPTEEDKLLI